MGNVLVPKRRYNTSTMNSSPKPASKFPRLLLPANSDREMVSVLPFFVLVLLAMAFLYTFTLLMDPAARQPAVLIPFTILMLLHSALHWNMIRIARRPGGALLYLGLQGGLALAIILVSSSSALSYGLYMGLVGESIGMLRKLTYKTAAVITFVSLSAISVIFVGREQSAMAWLAIILPMTLFVVVYTSLYGRESVARQKAQILADDLEAANHQLAEYAREIESLTLSNERQRMARELHDTLAQGLAGLILQLEAADLHLSSGRSERAQTIVQQAMSRARSTLAESRQVIDDLRSTKGTLAGLEQSVRKEVERFSEATGIPCGLSFELSGELPTGLEEVACRAVAEGLTNIARHAQASRAWVQIAEANGCLEIEIGDDGRGFDLEREGVRPGHYGLLGMRERARLAGGNLTLASRPGEGALLRLVLPLNSEAK